MDGQNLRKLQVMVFAERDDSTGGRFEVLGGVESASSCSSTTNWSRKPREEKIGVGESQVRLTLSWPQPPSTLLVQVGREVGPDQRQLGGEDVDRAWVWQGDPGGRAGHYPCYNLNYILYIALNRRTPRSWSLRKCCWTWCRRSLKTLGATPGRKEGAAEVVVVVGLRTISYHPRLRIRGSIKPSDSSPSAS